MKKIWLLAKSNISKGKGQAVSFFAVILTAALLMNIGLVTWRNYEQNYDRKAAAGNTADLVFVAQADEDTAEKFEQQLNQDERTKDTEVRDILFAGGKFQYSGGEQSRGAVLLKKDSTAKIGKISFTETVEENYDKPIYLPYLFQSGGGYQLGDTFSIRLFSMSMEKEFAYRIAGFYEETFIGTINSTFTGFILEEGEYQELSEIFADEISGKLFAVQLHDRAESESYVTDLTGKLKSGAVGMYDTNHYEATKMARTTTSSIGAILVVAFSIIIVLVALIIVKFRIGNSIEEDMKNIGALKAIGYTNRQIISSFVLQFGIIALMGAVIGILLSYLVLPWISGLFAAQTGVIWEQSFDAVTSTVTLLVLLILIIGVSSLSCRRIGKLTPIVALRSGLATHSFRRNYCPLDGRFGRLLPALAGKSFFQNAKQNILIGVIIAAVSFAAAFAGVMNYNIAGTDGAFIKMAAGETADIQLQVETADKAAAEALVEKMAEIPGISSGYLFGAETAALSGSMEIYWYITEDFAQYKYQDMLYAGRYPQYDNEIALNGLAAQAAGKKIGDTVMIQLAENQQEYLITGLIQGSNYMGHDGCITSEAWRRLDQEHNYSNIYLFVNEGTKIAPLLEQLENDFTEVKATVNAVEMLESSMQVYKDVIGLLIAVIAVITAVIVVLTLYLVVKANLIREKQKYGIQKALGYTTGQLVFLSSGSLLPVIAGGAALGCAAARVGLNPLLSLLFGSIGIMKANFVISPVLLFGLLAAITLFGFLTAAAVSGRIRRITPYTLMNE